jgi:hypothetical protein
VGATVVPTLAYCYLFLVDCASKQAEDPHPLTYDRALVTVLLLLRVGQHHPEERVIRRWYATAVLLDLVQLSAA